MSLEIRVLQPGAPAACHELKPGAALILGRGRDADLLLLDPDASRQHLRLELGPGGLVVTDLGSSNGTFLASGERLPPHQPRQLPLGAELRIGATTLRLGAAATIAEDYERIAELGRGGYGIVFHARHRASGREVAIKVLNAQAAAPSARERFLREARTCVEAPQIARVYEARSQGSQLFLVMELVCGPSLEARLRQGPLPLPEVVRVGLEIGRGLAAAHAAGVVHRDVKPANVLLGQDGAVKLVDFGIATERGSVLTATGTGLGTLEYVAPEQAEDAKRVSASADLYSMGATLYHAIAGHPPFDSKSPDFFEHLFTDDPRPLKRLRPETSTRLDRLVQRLLEKHPDDRPPNAEAVVRSLEQLA